MKPARFEYAAPSSVEALLSLLSARGANAAMLAGGQSLMPLLNRRRVRPGLLVDLYRIAGMDGIGVRADKLCIGAMTRQREIEFSELVSRHTPLLSQAIKYVGNPATRNRGTLGGSVAFADPQAELPACMVCLDATFWLASEAGSRSVPAVDFFLARQKTTLLPTEALLSIEIPICPDRPSTFAEVSRRARDQAIVGVAARVLENGEAVAVLFGIAEQPMCLRSSDFDAHLPIALPLNDENLSHQNRLRVAKILLQRAFEELAT
jgi:aerobic carbon-monoxide dehydrogenase medium subunit